MPKFLLIMLLSLTTMNVNALNNKQLALSEVKYFFNLKRPKLILTGRFINTAPEYGSTCKVLVDFSKPGKEHLTVTGEYTAAGNIGDGIYFNVDKSTFVQVVLLNKQLILKQVITDSLSTGTTTTVKLSKDYNTLRFTLYQQSYFLFIPQIVEKTCLVDRYSHK